MSEATTTSERVVTSRAVFCAHCVAESTDQTPGNVSTTNGIGRKFYGGAAPCSECASVIRTLWWCAVDIPLIPLGSYRYKTSQDESPTFLGTRALFWCRKLRGLYWPQVWPTWLIGITAFFAIIIGVVAYHQWRH